MFKRYFKSFFISIFIFLGVCSFAYASTTNGTIDAVEKTALLCKDNTCIKVPTSASQINFKPSSLTSNQVVHITDTEITGFVWSSDMGWIVLNCSNTASGCSPTNGNFKIENDKEGHLSGYAWGQNAGWINFGPFLNNSADSVSINNTGEFGGYAWAQNYGWIKFDCAVTNGCVSTDWRPKSTRGNEGGTGISGGGGTITPPVIPPTIPPVEPPVIPPVVPPVTPPVVEPIVPVVTPPVIPPTEIIPEPVTPPTNEVPTTPPPVSPLASSKDTSNSTPSYSSIPGFAITQVVIDQVFASIKESFKTIVDTSQKAAKEIKKIIETPQGNVISKVVTTSGAISGAVISIATVLFANPLSFSELFLIPFRLWSLLLAALGLKKRNRPWGTVYDSVTKQPLDPAYVTLEDLNGNEVVSSITDLDGRYGFLVPAGQYRMTAKKTNYNFPSVKLAGKTRDELYQELYFNEIINVEEGGVISKNIPMDPLKFDWNEFAKRDQKLMKFFSKRDLWVARLSSILFILGFIVTLVAALVAPAPYNIGILVVYLVLFLLKRTILKPRAYGHIKNKEDKNPLPFAIMRVFYAGSETEVIHKVTDKTGKYFCLVPNGTYYTKIENKNPDETYTLVHTSEPIEVKKGYISEKFEI